MTSANAVAFEPLQAAYHHRLAAAQAARAGGLPVIGYVGNTVPVELILAAGGLPVRIAPEGGSTEIADRYVETVSDPELRWIFDAYCRGGLDMLSMLVVPRSTETQHKLYLSLREAQRIGLASLADGRPPLWLYDLPHTQRPTSAAYGLERTRALWQALAQACGTACDEARLREAIALMNRQRAAVARLQALRDGGSVSGREALVAIGALRFLPPAEGAQRLEDWLAAGGPSPRPAGPRLLLRGVPAEHDRLHALIESLGAVIVAEDGDWGSREGATCAESPEGPLSAIAHHHASVVPCVRRHPADDAWFEQQLQRADIDAVLFHLPPPDDVHGWSYPSGRARAETAGKPSLRLRTDTRDAEATRPAIADFLATLRR